MNDIPISFRDTQRIAGIRKKHRDAFFDEMNPRDGQLDAFYAIADIINGKRKMLVLVGESQIGKSYLLSGYVNTMLKKDHNESREATARYMTFFDLELSLRSAQTLGRMDVLYNELIGYPHLVIDEIGRGKWSEFTSTFFTNLLIRRTEEWRDTLMATNLSGSELKDMFDLALIERLKNDKGIVLVEGE